MGWSEILALTGSITVTVHVASAVLSPLEAVAVIVALPLPTAVTVPSLSTFAMEGALDSHATSAPLGSTVAVKSVVSSFLSSIDVSLREMLSSSSASTEISMAVDCTSPALAITETFPAAWPVKVIELPFSDWDTAFVSPVTLHVTEGSVAPSGVTVAVIVTESPTLIVLLPFVILISMPDTATVSDPDSSVFSEPPISSASAAGSIPATRQRHRRTDKRRDSGFRFMIKTPSKLHCPQGAVYIIQRI